MWKIKPGESVGPIAFGMTVDEVTNILGTKFERFKRTEDSEEDTLSFDDECVQIVINGLSEVTNISIFRARKIFLGNIQLLDRNINELKSDLDSLEFHFVDFNGGLWCEGAKIVLVEFNGKTDGVEMERI